MARYNGKGIEQLLARDHQLNTLLNKIMDRFPNKDKDNNITNPFGDRHISNAYLDRALRETAEELKLPPTEGFSKAINAVYSEYPIVNLMTMKEEDRRMLTRDDFRKELIELLKRLAQELNKHPIVIERPGKSSSKSSK